MKRKKEFVDAEKCTFEIFDFNGTRLVCLTPENVSMAEEIIRSNPFYKRAYDRNARPNGRYNGSTAYWFNQMKPLLNGKSLSPDGYDWDCVVSNVVRSIDIENRTHINADGVGRIQLAERIRILGNELPELLRNRDSFKLIELIYAETKPTNPDRRPRRNVSFASKFCHYASLYLFEGELEQDNYSIYDSVIRCVLPLYAERYDVEHGRLDDYSEYCRVIDAIREKNKEETGYGISRNGFDHLLWCFHKNRI